MTGRYFILADGQPQPVDDVADWAAWVGAADRTVARTIPAPGVVVSTVFLGIDHRLPGRGPPILFETMTFGPDDWFDAYCDRYATWIEAEAGHALIVEAVRNAINDAAREEKKGLTDG